MPKQNFTWLINRFMGLRLDQSSRTIDPGAMVTAQNVDLRYLDQLQGRNTRVKLWDPGTVVGLQAFKDELFYSTSSNLYNRGTLLKSSWGGWFDLASINQWAYLANGTTFIRSDGTNVYEVGITAPTAPSVATGAAGALSGDYRYRVTYVDSDGFESNGGTVSAQVSPSSEKVELTGIPTGNSDEGVAERKIYRTVAGGSTYYLLTTLSDATTTTYSDNTTDANLGSTVPPLNHDKPTATFTGVAVAGDRLFGFVANSRRLYFTLPFPNERAQPSTYYRDMPDYIRGIKALGVGTLLVVCENGPYAVAGLSNPDLFYYNPLSGPRFYVKSSRVTANFLDGVITQGAEGVYLMNSAKSTWISQKIISQLTTLSDVAAMVTTPKVAYLIVGDSSLDENEGVSVYILHESDVATFQAGTPGGNKEYGIPTTIEDDDTYVFTSEVGIIVHIGSSDQAQITKVDTHHGLEFFSYTFGIVNEGDVQVITYDNRDRSLYVGGTNGIHKLAGGRVRYTTKFGFSYLGVPNIHKWLQRIHIGYLKGTVKANVYVDGSTTSSWTNERTIYVNNTSINANDTSIGADGQTAYDGPAELQCSSDLSGVTFQLELDVCGELHAPILFSGRMGDLI